MREENGRYLLCSTPISQIKEAGLAAVSPFVNGAVAALQTTLLTANRKHICTKVSGTHDAGCAFVNVQAALDASRTPPSQGGLFRCWCTFTASGKRNDPRHRRARVSPRWNDAFDKEFADHHTRDSAKEMPLPQKSPHRRARR